MQGAIAVFLITLGLGQIISTSQGWRAASLVGSSRLGGYGLGLALVIAGALILPNSWGVLGWAVLAGPLVVGLLLWTGSFVVPPPHPDVLFSPDHPGHGTCLPVQIPDGEFLMPGLLVRPGSQPHPSKELLTTGQPTANDGNYYPTPNTQHPTPIYKGGVLLVHGAGDTKTSFKWRLVQALLAEGLIVLSIDLPGHGDYRCRPLAYPDCLSAIPAAIQFLKSQPGVERVGLVGISLGSAMAIRSLAENQEQVALSPIPLDALAALEMPIEVNYSRMLRYREMWHAYRAPVLSLLSEITVKQMIKSWHTGGYISRHKNTGEIIALLNPLAAISRLKNIPILLVHGESDIIAPPAVGRTLQQAAPQAALLTVKKASHVTLTLMPEVNRQVAKWLRESLNGG